MTRKTKLNIVLWVFSFIVVLFTIGICLAFVALWTLHPTFLALTLLVLGVTFIRYWLADDFLHFIYWKL